MFAMNLAGNLVTIQVHNSFLLPIELKKIFHDEKVNFIPLHLKDIFVNGKFILILYIYWLILSCVRYRCLNKSYVTGSLCDRCRLVDVKSPIS